MRNKKEEAPAGKTATSKKAVHRYYNKRVESVNLFIFLIGLIAELVGYWLPDNRILYLGIGATFGALMIQFALHPIEEEVEEDG
jgi:hypothetical protein